MAAKPDPYANIDFEEICEATGLAIDEIKCLKVGRRVGSAGHTCGNV
jgi:hypothetical protein